MSHKPFAVDLLSYASASEIENHTQQKVFFFRRDGSKVSKGSRSEVGGLGFSSSPYLVGYLGQVTLSLDFHNLK